MKTTEVRLNGKVTKFLDELQHARRSEIEMLRAIILNSAVGLNENIKWNGPNYVFNEHDLITMRIQPLNKIQLIFHRGAKKTRQPPGRLIQDHTGILTWKENDRAIASFKKTSDIVLNKENLIQIVKDWIEAAMQFSFKLSG